MKKIKVILCLLLMSVATAFAGDLSPVQEKAQRSIYSFLLKNKYDPTVDTSDNSVCFRKNDVLYWITFEGDSPLLYTFHRKAFKVGVGDKDFKSKPAIMACNEVNRKHKTVKLTVGEKRVDIAIQVYAAKPEDFTAVLITYFNMFDKVDTDFKSAYAAAIKAEREHENKLEQEARKDLPPSELRGLIQSASFRLVSEDDKVVTEYDKPLRAFNARYIQAAFELGPWKEKAEEYVLQLKITKPDGKTIFLPGKKYTAEAKVTIEKSKKNQFVEFDKFGSNKEGFWKAGEYKVEVLESGDTIYQTSFNIL